MLDSKTNQLSDMEKGSAEQIGVPIVKSESGSGSSKNKPDHITISLSEPYAAIPVSKSNTSSSNDKYPKNNSSSVFKPDENFSPLATGRSRPGKGSTYQYRTQPYQPSYFSNIWKAFKISSPYDVLLSEIKAEGQIMSRLNKELETIEKKFEELANNNNPDIDLVYERSLLAEEEFRITESRKFYEQSILDKKQRLEKVWVHRISSTIYYIFAAIGFLASLTAIALGIFFPGLPSETFVKFIDFSLSLLTSVLLARSGGEQSAAIAHKLGEKANKNKTTPSLEVQGKLLSQSVEHNFSIDNSTPPVPNIIGNPFSSNQKQEEDKIPEKPIKHNKIAEKPNRISHKEQFSRLYKSMSEYIDKNHNNKKIKIVPVYSMEEALDRVEKSFKQENDENESRSINCYLFKMPNQYNEKKVDYYCLLENLTDSNEKKKLFLINPNGTIFHEQVQNKFDEKEYEVTYDCLLDFNNRQVLTNINSEDAPAFLYHDFVELISGNGKYLDYKNASTVRDIYQKGPNIASNDNGLVDIIPRRI